MNTNEKLRTLQFNLAQNKEHPFSDYNRSVKNSPCIPFNADKRPGASVLKPSPSPILIHKPFLKSLKSSPIATSSSPKLKKLKRLSLPVATCVV